MNTKLINEITELIRVEEVYLKDQTGDVAHGFRLALGKIKKILHRHAKPTSSTEDGHYSGIRHMVEILKSQIKKTCHGDLTEFGEGSVFFLKDMLENAEMLNKEEIKRHATPAPCPKGEKEPMEELARRKGWYIGAEYFGPAYTKPGIIIKDQWIIEVMSDGYTQICFAPTYALAEAAARTFLEGLENVKGVK